MVNVKNVHIQLQSKFLFFSKIVHSLLDRTIEMQCSCS